MRLVRAAMPPCGVCEETDGTAPKLSKEAPRRFVSFISHLCFLESFCYSQLMLHLRRRLF